MACASPSAVLLKHQHPLARASIEITANVHHKHKRVAARAQSSKNLAPLLHVTIMDIQAFCQNQVNESLQPIVKFIKGQKDFIIQETVDAFCEVIEEPNLSFEGNFAPVEEIGTRVQVEIIEGSVPKHFPSGVYVRNGPNPQFGASSRNFRTFGRTNYHWFEGDGMLHATYFEFNGQISYLNKYIETKGFLEERRKGKQLWLNTIEGDSKALALSFLLNQVQFGEANKATANTSIFTHAGRLFANAETHIPYEIDPRTLSTLGEWNIGKQWGRPLTAHPKVLQETKELAIFGFSPLKPYYMTGLVSAKGDKIIHTCNVGLDKPSFTHDLAITKNYVLIMDFSLTIDPRRLFFGGELIQFDTNAPSRVGIKPIQGNESSIRWFPVKTNYTFHVINSYEEGDEVVLYGCQARRPFIYSKLSITRKEWFARGIQQTLSAKDRDPNIDGALFTNIHEWRFNLQTGLVKERDITSHPSSMDMPKINDKYTGSKNRFGYASVLDHKASSLSGMPKYGSLAKIDFSQEDVSCNVELYTPGYEIYCSEPQFVPDPDGACEDDGWVVSYIHDENKNQSEVHIVDAQAFSKGPIAKIKLPQRVPYGFHGAYLQGSF